MEKQINIKQHMKQLRKYLKDNKKPYEEFKTFVSKYEEKSEKLKQLEIEHTTPLEDLVNDTKTKAD